MASTETVLRETILLALGENQKNKQIVDKLNERELTTIVRYINEQSVTRPTEIIYSSEEILSIIKNTKGMKLEDLKRIKKQIKVSKFTQFVNMISKHVEEHKNMVEELIQADILDWLFESLRYHLYLNYSIKKETENDKLNAIINIMDQILHTPGVLSIIDGKLRKIKDCIQIGIRVLEYANVKNQSRIFYILYGYFFNVPSADDHKTVLGEFLQFFYHEKSSLPYHLQNIYNKISVQLREGDDFVYKQNYLSLMNELLSRVPDAGRRVFLREKYLSQELFSILKDKAKQFNSVTFQKNITAFDKLLQRDKKTMTNPKQSSEKKIINPKKGILHNKLSSSTDSAGRAAVSKSNSYTVSSSLARFPSDESETDLTNSQQLINLLVDEFPRMPELNYCSVEELETKLRDVQTKNDHNLINTLDSIIKYKKKRENILRQLFGEKEMKCVKDEEVKGKTIFKESLTSETYKSFFEKINSQDILEIFEFNRDDKAIYPISHGQPVSKSETNDIEVQNDKKANYLKFRDAEEIKKLKSLVHKLTMSFQSKSNPKGDNVTLHVSSKLKSGSYDFTHSGEFTLSQLFDFLQIFPSSSTHEKDFFYYLQTPPSNHIVELNSAFFSLKYPDEPQLFTSIPLSSIHTLSCEENLLHQFYSITPNPRIFIYSLIITQKLGNTQVKLTRLFSVVEECMNALLDDHSLRQFFLFILFIANQLLSPPSPIDNFDLVFLDYLRNYQIRENRSFLHFLIEVIETYGLNLLQFLDKIHTRTSSLFSSERAMRKIISTMGSMSKYLSVEKHCDSAFKDYLEAAKSVSLSFAERRKNLTEKMVYFGYTNADSDPAQFFSILYHFFDGLHVGKVWLDSFKSSKSSPTAILDAMNQNTIEEEMNLTRSLQ